MSEPTTEIAGAYEHARDNDRELRDESISDEIDTVDRLVNRIAETGGDDSTR